MKGKEQDCPTHLQEALGRWKPLSPALGHSNQEPIIAGPGLQPLLCLPAKVCSRAPLPSALRPDRGKGEEGISLTGEPRKPRPRGPSSNLALHSAKVLTGCSQPTLQASPAGDLQEARARGREKHLCQGLLPLGQSSATTSLFPSSRPPRRSPSSLFSTSQKLHPWDAGGPQMPADCWVRCPSPAQLVAG